MEPIYKEGQTITKSLLARMGKAHDAKMRKLAGLPPKKAPPNHLFNPAALAELCLIPGLSRRAFQTYLEQRQRLRMEKIPATLRARAVGEAYAIYHRRPKTIVHGDELEANHRRHRAELHYRAEMASRPTAA